MYYDEFKNYLKANGFGVTHSDHIRKFLQYISQNHRDPMVMTYDQLASYINERRDAGAKQGTINNHIKAIKQYYRFLIDVHNCPAGQLEMVSKFKQKQPPKLLKQTLSLEEFTKMMGRLLQHCKPRMRIKIVALFYFMFFTGLRKSDVVTLKRADIDLNKNSVFVRMPTKGRMEYRMYYPGEVGDYMRKYFKHDPELENAFNINERGLEYLISWSNRYLPKNQHITAHTFRWSFASMSMEGDLNIKLMQKMMGHKSIDSTLHYCDPDPRIVEKVYREKFKFQPPVVPIEGVEDENTNSETVGENR